MTKEYTIVEKDSRGRQRRTLAAGGKVQVQRGSNENISPQHVTDLLAKIFLPSGYPSSVSPDYLRYQILNALQAFCNSLAGLLSSRAILEGFGIGDPSATAQDALYLTVLQDVFSRFATVFGAYALGSSLVPEAKTYRLLADILNDAAVILDTISPTLSSMSTTVHIPGFRVAALCLSASFRALCSVSAGGSKAAITLHFATPINGNGDVGDLNAKDSSKETVLALLGMLLGTLVVSHITTPALTYSMLAILVTLHLVINYYGVRGLEFRSLNRQRTAITWVAYRSAGGTRVPSPSEVSKYESILGRPDLIRNEAGYTIGQCSIGSCFSDVFQDGLPTSLLDIFEQEQYILWYDHQCLFKSPGDDNQKISRVPVHLHALLKEGYSAADQLKAWCHAVELCRAVSASPMELDHDSALVLIQRSLDKTSQELIDFIELLRDTGWNTNDIALMTGSPKSVLTSVETKGDSIAETRKSR